MRCRTIGCLLVFPLPAGCAVDLIGYVGVGAITLTVVAVLLWMGIRRLQTRPVKFVVDGPAAGPR